MVWRNWLTGLIALVLVACAPVREWDPMQYTVQRGDTLYSIAWRYELDFQDIARWNSIDPPYAIYPGQRLRLSADTAAGSYGHDTVVAETDVPDSAEIQAATLASSIQGEGDVRADSVVVKKGDTLYALARQHNVNAGDLARWNALKSPYVLRPGQTLRLQPPAGSSRQATAAGNAATTRTKKSTDKQTAGSVAASKTSAPVPAVSGWQWPVKGRVLKSFKANDTARKGIRIAGKSGQPVMAAANGKVVYSGNGLISYGNLIIIKHDDNYLSAYAYNQELLVSEGDEVRARQQIARMGEENGRAQLHFEIRKNGKPVNPLQYLPKG